jgi:amino acid transporter
LGYELAFVEKVNLIIKIILYFYTDNISSGMFLLYAITAFLLSYTMILVAYYFKKRQTLTGIKKLSLSGLMALLGVGCAACGGVLLSSILNIAGATTLLVALPYGGSEFLVLAIALLLYSVTSISKKINAPLVC